MSEETRNILSQRQQQRRSKRNALKHQAIPNSRNMGLKEIMDDLTIRFIMNCPEEEFESFDRLFFQIEEAHWFYEDFYREHNKTLPAMNFRVFVDKVFEHCPVLSPFREAIEGYIQSFYDYKTTVPVYGAIILNQAQDKVLLVKGWTSKSWTFPRGKINQDEPELICAAREVKEEIGFDISPYLRESDYIHMNFNEQSIKLFIVSGIPETVVFTPQTRKEIRAIEWHSIDSIMQARSPSNPKKSASKFWTIAAFMPKLKRWLLKSAVNSNKKRRNSPQQQQASTSSSPTLAEETTPKNNQKRGRRGRKSPELHSNNTTSQQQQRERSSSAPAQPEPSKPKRIASRKLSFNNNDESQPTASNPPVILKRSNSPQQQQATYSSYPPPQHIYHHMFNPYPFVQQQYAFQSPVYNYSHHDELLRADNSITSVVV